MNLENRRAVLSEQLRDNIGSRRVKSAVFLTYEFDPEFFELHVLPQLFDRGFSPNPRVSMLQAEDAIREEIDIAVYYDRRGLVPEAGSASLDYRRIDVSRKDGVFHSKNILLLLEEGEEEGPTESLLIVTTSANLTRSGWWSNLESAHFLELPEGSLSQIRDDLLTNGGLISRLEREDRTGSKPQALDMIRGFLQKKIFQGGQRSSGGILFPRLFVGRQSVPNFLVDEVRIDGSRYFLEVISPFFDNTDGAETLKVLIAAVKPKSTRVFLPRKEDGTALCREPYFHAVASIPDVEWGELPKSMTRWSDNERVTKERYVHAKVYRLFSKELKKEYLLTGSVNLTDAAHSPGSKKNFETAVFLESPEIKGKLDWWMTALPPDVMGGMLFGDPESEEKSDLAVHNVSFQYQWAERRLSYFWEETQKNPRQVDVLQSGVKRFSFTPVRFGEWVDLSAECAAAIREGMRSTTFLEIIVDGAPPQRVLVREEGMEGKPSIRGELTPEEIMEYWSLLSPEQKTAFWERKVFLFPGENEEALARQVLPDVGPESMFDRFAGIFHAFASMEVRIREGLEGGRRKRDVQYLLFGNKYDSLSSLIEKVLSAEEADPVNQYVTLLCAKRLIEKLPSIDEMYCRDNMNKISDLNRQLNGLHEIRGRLLEAEEGSASGFLEWFERIFFTDIRMPEGAAEIA